MIHLYSIDCGKRILAGFTWDLRERNNNAKVINILRILQIKYPRSIRFTTKANIYILRGTRLFCNVNHRDVSTRNHNTFAFRYRLISSAEIAANVCYNTRRLLGFVRFRVYDHPCVCIL